MEKKLVNLTPHTVTLVCGNKVDVKNTIGNGVYKGSNDKEFVIVNGATVIYVSYTVDIQPSGQVARVSATAQQVGTITIDGFDFPVVKTVFGEVTGLPEPQEDTVYIVSTLVLSAVQGRNDLVAPNTGAAIRDADGKIVGVPGFQVL